MPCHSRHYGRPCQPESGAVDVAPLPRVKMLAPRVAIVYTGRWMGVEGTRSAIANHLLHVIAPNNASVYVTTDGANWCSAPVQLTEGGEKHPGPQWTSIAREEAQAAFCAQVNAAFKGLWADVSCALLPEADAGIALRYQAHAAERFGSNFGGYMRSWYLQAAQFTRANAFRRMIATGPHHLILRARFELWFGSPVRLRELPTRPPAIYALSYAVETTGEPNEWLSAIISVTRQCWRRGARPHGESTMAGKRVEAECPEKDYNGRTMRVLWRDWLYAGNEEAMDALARLSMAPHRMLLSAQQRCFGACPEEQTMLHLERAGMATKELNWPVNLVAPTCNDARWFRPLLNKSARDGPCAKFGAHISSRACRRPQHPARR